MVSHGARHRCACIRNVTTGADLATRCRHSPGGFSISTISIILWSRSLVSRNQIRESSPVFHRYSRQATTRAPLTYPTPSRTGTARFRVSGDFATGTNQLMTSRRPDPRPGQRHYPLLLPQGLVGFDENFTGRLTPLRTKSAARNSEKHVASRRNCRLWRAFRRRQRRCGPVAGTLVEQADRR